MADIDLSPSDVSPEGLTLPLGGLKGKKSPKPGDVLTLGASEEQWEVLRVDGVESVVHLVRADKVAALKRDHEKRGLRPDGSMKGA